MKEGYIKRKTSTIPFGYETSEIEGYFKPISEEIEALKVAEDLVAGESISLRDACDWIEFKTHRSITPAGLKKHIDKKYGKREQRLERLGTESTSLLDRF
tara:strand:+ start:612 stop:911 length:300 start_codon:yes stop_codon:yes gene_type:complete